MYRQSGIRLSSAIMVHPVRLASAQELMDGHPELGFSLAVDPEPGRMGALRTARVAWGSVAHDATHHLVVQDDSVLCPDFAEHVTSAIRTMPHAALSFFVEWGACSSNMVRMAALRGKAWAEVVDVYVPMQALVLPAEIARGFDDYARTNAVDEDPDDHVLRAYLHSVGVPAYVSVPNIVEHKDLPSLVGNGIQGRRSSTCYVAGTELGRLPRHGTLAAQPVVPYFSWMNGNAKCLVRDVAGGWRSQLVADVLRSHGMSDVTGGHVMTSALSSLPTTTRIQHIIDPGLLAGLWTTAVALGIAACGSGEFPDIAGAVDTPLARSALATLAVGGLRRFVEWETLNRVRGDLDLVVATGVRAGIDAVAAGKLRPFGSLGHGAAIS